MGTRGPLPKKRTPLTKGKSPSCPKHLGESGKRLWRRVAAGLKDRSGFVELHADALERACKLADEIDVLEKYIDQHGWTDEGPNGIEYLRPQVKQLNVARRQIQFYEKEFGLTSAADERIRGTPEPPKEEDALEALRNFKVTG